MTENTPAETPPEAALTRTQSRLLRRICNGRTLPIMADGLPFLTYRAAKAYLLSLPPEAREAAYAQMKAQARSPRHAPL